MKSNRTVNIVHEFVGRFMKKKKLLCQRMYLDEELGVVVALVYFQGENGACLPTEIPKELLDHLKYWHINSWFFYWTPSDGDPKPEDFSDAEFDEEGYKREQVRIKKLAQDILSGKRKFKFFGSKEE